MTEHIFNENTAILNDETHNALVSHFNKIEEFAKNKKYEWEDEQLPEEHYNVTFDFNEWLLNAESEVIEIYKFEHHSVNTNSLKEELTEYVDKIKEYIDGFILTSTVIYNHRGLMAKSKSYKEEEFGDGVVEFMKQLKENNDKVFLYMIYKIPARPEPLEIIEESKGQKYTSRFPKQDTQYKLRYAVYNDD